MRPAELIRLSTGIENQIDSSGDLKPLPGKDSALFSISHRQTGDIRFFRYDLQGSVRGQIEALDPEVALKSHKAVRQILARYISCVSVSAGKGYHFAHSPS